MEGILNNEYSSLLMNSINHHQYIEHQEKLNLLIAEQEMVYMKTFNLCPYKDGDQWCVLLGKNIQDGIAGFGETPIKAIYEFNKNFLTQIAK